MQIIHDVGLETAIIRSKNQTEREGKGWKEKRNSLMNEYARRTLKI